MPHLRIITLLLAALLAPVCARAQSIKDGIIGAWHLVSVASETDAGTRGEPFGPTPKGIMLFTGDGHFSLFQSTGELPRVAANDRARATAEEALAVMRGAIAYYGTYTVDEATRELSVKLDASTFANVVAGGAAQRRIVTRLTATELAFSNPRTPSGMTLHTVWRRAAAQ